MNNNKCIIKQIAKLKKVYDDNHKKIAVITPNEDKSEGYLYMCIIDGDNHIVYSSTERVLYDEYYNFTNLAEVLSKNEFDVEIKFKPEVIKGLTVRELREKTGLNKKDFSRLYNIPYHTLRSWEEDVSSARHRKCPKYVITLLEKAVKEDFLGMGN